MKNIIILAVLYISSNFFLACNTNNAPKDSVDSANKQNQSKDSNLYGTGNMDSMAADEQFLVKAFSGGMLEVMLGKTAQQNAASAQVKQFGQMMVTDHTKADSEMAVIAKLKNITLPDKPGEDEYKR